MSTHVEIIVPWMHNFSVHNRPCGRKVVIGKLEDENSVLQSFVIARQSSKDKNTSYQVEHCQNPQLQTIEYGASFALQLLWTLELLILQDPCTPEIIKSPYKRGASNKQL